MDNLAFENSIESDELQSREQIKATVTDESRPPTRVKKNSGHSSNFKEAFLPTLHESQSSMENEQELKDQPTFKISEAKMFTPAYVTEETEDAQQLEVTSPGNHGTGPEENISNKIKRKPSTLRKIVRNISRDVIPSIDNYRMRYHNPTSNSRPSLHELCYPQARPYTNHTDVIEESSEKGINTDITEPDVEKVKFGWIEGVLIRNMMSIWGVMLFLRLSWVVGQAGIGETLVIIAISTFITLVTALSMSAISTNGEIGGGGTYFVMSRILGPEFGGSIGLIFTAANVMDCALNVVGFSQTVSDMMKEYGGIVFLDGGDNEIRVIGTITMVFIFAICGLGSQYETKVKDVMIILMLTAFANFLSGSIMGPKSDLEEARGFIGYSVELLKENWAPAYTITNGQMQNFISVFSVYFPACIGILAGANVSGELKDPNKAIPKGTILAIIYCSIAYVAIAIICGVTVARQATGSVIDFANGTNLDCFNATCHYGLYYDYQAMSLVSSFAPINYVGCIAATLSSSMSDFASCPALLEVIAADKLYPYWMIGFLGKGYGASKQPYRAHVCTFFLVLVFILIAKLDVIALLISNFFLATFALINFSTFHISLVKPIGWRPTFKYYNTWLSLLTGVMSIVAMFLISLPVALITMAVVLFFYSVVLYRKPEVNWGSSTQAQTYSAALASIQQLVHIEDHVKNFRPQILVLTGLPSTRPALVDFAYLICKRNSLMICSNIVQEHLTAEMRSKLQQKAYRYLRLTNIKGFCSIVDNTNLSAGVAAMLGLSGVGKVKPNILMLGYKNDWSTCDVNSLEEYVSTIQTAFEMNVAVTILRLYEGLDCSEILGDIDDVMHVSKSFGDRFVNRHKPQTYLIARGNSTDSSTATKSLPSSQSTVSFEVQKEEGSEHQPLSARHSVAFGITTQKQSRKKLKQAITYRDPYGNELPKSVMNKIIFFQKKQKKDTIDVWWLSDDGGLTLLLPVIINSRSNWSETKLRIFCTASGVQELEKEQKGMAVLLSKFRIEYSDLVIISDLNEAPTNKTKIWFDNLIRPFLQPNANGSSITEGELEALQYKTDRHLRLRDLLLDHSADSNLVVMTLPLPRKEAQSPRLYMAWMEALTANMPPFLLVRGNQTSVLTFYV